MKVVEGPELHRWARHMAIRCTLCVLLATIITIPGLPADAQSTANDDDSSTLQLDETDNGVRVRWRAIQASTDVLPGDTTLATQPYGGNVLPIQMFSVQTSENGGATLSAAELSIEELVDEPWAGEVIPAPALEPPVLDWNPPVQTGPQANLSLPTQPVSLLRVGKARGRSISVFGFSEVYRNADGNLRRVVSLDVTLPGTRILSNEDLLSDAQFAIDAHQSEAPVDLTDALDSSPPNAVAAQQSVKVFVAAQGIQHIQGYELREAGLSQPHADRLQLFLRGTEVPLHILDYNGDGYIGENEAVRFYADKPGDRWNSEDVYWIVEGSASGSRMGYRNVEPGDAAIRTTALATGVWQENRLYESMLFGPDGDNWFHDELTADALVSTAVSENDSEAVVASLAVPLPLAANSGIDSVFTVGGTAIDARNDSSDSSPVPHRLRLSGGTVSHVDAVNDWTFAFDVQPAHDFKHTIRTQGVTSSLNVGLAAGPQPSHIYLDQVEWQMPIQLDFGGKGASFLGVSGQWKYRLHNVPDDAVLYDVTQPQRPVILGHTIGSTHLFEDGPDPRAYLLAADGTVHTPRVEIHKPIAATLQNAADVVYVAPAAFHDALEPLLDLRKSQSRIAITVDVQEIYDGWGYGFVDPDAIRDYLRAAVGAWSHPPIAAVLVGDGTEDPMGYGGSLNPNHIPPYLADVDPWIRVAPCDNCYAQLDGEDPLSENAFLTDILLGRLPVADVGELTAVVDKIVRYEMGNRELPSQWRNTSVQFADDWISSDGSRDGAGNFAASVERIALLQPPEIQYTRLFYNASVDPKLLDEEARSWLERIRPWVEQDADRARLRAKAILRQGSGLVTFTGHANHWVWARLGHNGGYDNRLFGLWDVSSLDNRDELFIALSMTCLTAQFTKPAEYHFTLDEHLLLHPDGGAVAVWGPAGLSVAHGHDALQVGFYRRLWHPSTRPGRAPIGALVQAGYRNVAMNLVCCQDVTRTFLLLGDPLTPARVQALNVKFMPEINVDRARVRSLTATFMPEINVAPSVQP